jgi:hypothetical protein
MNRSRQSRAMTAATLADDGYAAASTAAGSRQPAAVGMMTGDLYAATSTAGSRREITLEIPSDPIDTPYSESAASIVRF